MFKSTVTRVLLLAVLSAGIAAGAWAAGAGDGASAVQEKVIQFWCSYSQPERIEAIELAIAGFQKANPGVTVKRELVPWANLRQKWISGKMAKTLPQLSVGGDGDLLSMWDGGVLAPVNDIVNELGGSSFFLPGPVAGLKVGGTQIAVPHYTLSWKMVVRKDWLDDLGLPVPKTWDEFAKAAIAMTDAPNRYGFDLPLSKTALKAREWLAYFMRTNAGSEFFDKNGKVNFYTPQTVETVNFLVDLYRKTGRQAAINYTEDNCIDNLIKGDLGFTFASGSMIRRAVAANPDILGKIQVIDTPIKNRTGIDGAGLVGIGKFKDVPHSKESSEFVKYLLRTEVYSPFLLSLTGMIPITIEGSKDPVYWENPMIKNNKVHYDKWLEGAFSGRRIGMDYGPTPIMSHALTGSEIEDMFQAILVDNIPVDRAVKQVHDKMVAQLAAAGF